VTTPGRGEADFWQGGDWNAVCYECGRKRKASTLKRHWQGYYVCPEHWEPRQPQDFVRGVQDVITPPWAQPQNDTFTAVCTLDGISATPELAMPGCMIPSRVFQYVPGIPGVYPSFCTIEGSYCTADFAMAGCATVAESPDLSVPPPSLIGFLLCENGSYLLQENGGRLIIQIQGQ
jgi:hypothetical protein